MTNDGNCNQHPKAPHGFDRSASHSAHRYVCECESWDPYDAGFNAGFQAGMKAEQALYDLSEEMKYTHKGWIGLCPVYIGNKDSASPDIDPRIPYTEWLMHLSLAVYDFVGSVTGNYNGGIPILVTGEAK